MEIGICVNVTYFVVLVTLCSDFVANADANS